ncbi:hypothetical protein [Krasilnikovia sp. M28-CT-15]|uniref:hypothetical protein n=1 Tax=Krasilnikovia sp. M28-CT-15 TaxID=3373540 RepID=UPI0038770608
MTSAHGGGLDEVWARARGAITAILTSGTQLAESLIELRIAALRRAVQQERDRERQVREQVRLFQQADAAIWRAAMRPQWWREAGAEDIGRVWRAASTWQHVDPRAAAARQVVVDRLAERGVHVDPAGQATPSPEDVAWLSDALDQAAAGRAAAGRSGPQAREAGEATPGEGPVIEGEPARAPRASRQRVRGPGPGWIGGRGRRGPRRMCGRCGVGTARTG